MGWSSALHHYIMGKASSLEPDEGVELILLVL